MTDTKPSEITEGDAVLVADCPECERTVRLPISLSLTLTVTSEGGYLRPSLSVKRIEHNCNGEDPADAPTMFDGDGQPFRVAE